MYAVVAVCAIAAAGTAAAVAWSGQPDSAEPVAAETGPRPGAPPLALDVLVEDVEVAEELQRAARLYASGDLPGARAAFQAIVEREPDLLLARVGEAMSRWPDGAIPRLRELEQEHPRSGLVKLHLGLARYWLRDEERARAAWLAAEEVDPDSPAAVRAETLLHPEMPQGRPFFVPSAPFPEDVADLPPLSQLEALERQARASETARAWIAYGVALQRAGRPRSAARAFDRAAELDPQSAEALAAAAVVRFDKDDPSAAFSRLGPLGERFPDAAVVRFHLGLMLLWLRQVDEARAQLERAIRLEPGSIYAREAELLLERLEEAAAGATTGS